VASRARVPGGGDFFAPLVSPSSALDTGAGFGMGGYPAQHDGPLGAVGLPVAATVEAVVAVGLARVRPQSPLVPVYRKHLIGRRITVAQQTVPRSGTARSQPAGTNAGSRPSNASCAGAASCPWTTTPPGRTPGSATSAAPWATPCTRSSTPATSGSPPQPFPGSYRSSPTPPSSSTARPTAAHRTATNLTPDVLPNRSADSTRLTRNRDQERGSGAERVRAPSRHVGAGGALRLGPHPRRRVPFTGGFPRRPLASSRPP